MKIFIFYLCLLFSSVSVLAQQQKIKNPEPKKFYVGVDFNTTPYYLKLNSQSTSTLLQSTYFTPYPGIHVGYQVSKKARIQIGAAYGTNRYYQQASTHDNNGVLEGNYAAVNTKGFIVPVSLRYDFLDVSNRFQAYGFATLTTAYTHTTLKSNTTQDGVVTSSDKTNLSGLGLFMGVGLGARYKLNNRFSVFGEYSVLNRNLTGGYTPGKKGLNADLLNLGLNYNF
ncbi:porin family protein [Adhaeribacter swui]|uniref:Porin family protein n=1 Tax=Adhaeribacter swui TaxID=2086471 RepID=A0A7G7G2R4_9BACT|nr:outer membrane beta-barrel protein [Adhaeribacter swui]QNF31448.1 porin family protein [Adhaeribacter swui]